MTLSHTKKLANNIFRLLKVNELIFPICRTSKGNFGIRFTPNNEDFEMYLDAVPLTITDSLRDDNNIELKKMLEKYLFDMPVVTSGYATITTTTESTPVPAPKKRGRPAKKK
jgi:hypothetical protein